MIKLVMFLTKILATIIAGIVVSLNLVLSLMMWNDAFLDDDNNFEHIWKEKRRY